MNECRKNIVSFTVVAKCLPFNNLKNCQSINRNSVSARRKDSYNEVLEWLFRDQPGSPAPNSANLCNAPTAVDQFSRCNNPEGQCYDGFGDSQQQYKPPQQPQQSRGRSIEGRRNDGLVRMGGSSGAAAPAAPASKHHRFFPRGNSSARSASIDAPLVRTQPPPSTSRPRNCSVAAPALDDANRFAHRAPMSSAVTRNIHEDNDNSGWNGNQGRRHGGGCPATGTTPASQGLLQYPGNAAEQPFSHGKPSARPDAGSNPFGSLTAGFADFGVQSSPEEIFSNGASGGGPLYNPNQHNSAPTSLGQTSNNYADPLSALPACDVYAMSDARPQESRCDGNSNLQSLLLAPGSKRNAFGQSPTSAAVNVNQLPVVEAPLKISREFFEEFRQENPHLFPVEEELLSDCKYF